MNKKKIVITCICLVVVMAAAVGMAVMRFGGDVDNTKDNTVMNNSGTVEDDKNKDESTENGKSDKNDKVNTSGSNGSNGNAADNNGQSIIDSEVKIPVNDEVEATLGGVTLDEKLDDPFENGSSSNGNTGGSGNSGNSGSTNTSGNISDGNTETEGSSGSSGADADTSLTYEEYAAMSSSDQQIFFESFDDPADFFEWYSEAKAEYDEAHPDIEVGNGEIDLGNMGN